MMLILFPIICIFITVIYYCNVNKHFWKIRNVVEVNNAAWDFLLGKCSMPEIYKNVYNAHPTEDYVGMYLISKPLLILRNLDDIRAVLKDSNCFHSRGYNVNEKEDLAQNLLLIDNYHRWKMIKQKITPILTIKKLKNMSSTIYECSASLLDYLKHYSYETNKSVYEKFNFVAIGSSIFGIEFATKNALASPIVNKLCDPLTFADRCKFTLKMILSMQFPYILSALNITLFHDYKSLILEIIQKITKHRRDTPGKREDYINMYMEIEKDEMLQDASGSKIKTDQFIASQAFSFFLAGVDTSATAIDFTFLELANNKDILEKVHKEIDEILDKHNQINYDNIDSFEYLDMVFSESLRKYPPIGSLQRVATNETILPSGLRVDKGIYVIIPVYGLHMDSKYFKDPEKFDPERFSTENIDKIKKYTYLPFSGGNRYCVGSKFARIQIKIMLAVLLREFTLRSCSYKVKTFDPNLFTICDSKVQYEFIPRERANK